jgi:hypothetical protein
MIFGTNLNKTLKEIFKRIVRLLTQWSKNYQVNNNCKVRLRLIKVKVNLVYKLKKWTKNRNKTALNWKIINNYNFTNL